MIRDPFYKQIVASLQGEVDPDAFERCADDLLREIYPTLVPIPGGGDAGMDGAIADGEGEAFQLVTTTSPDVIRNLGQSLRSYLSSGGERRKVVLATSQRLTPVKRRNLEKRARELDFTLIQVHDQAWFVESLYHSPTWCRELLGLAGNPPALSPIPRPTRPLLTQTLIGREADLAWLAHTRGDRLLIGQPGTGKTFLLRQLARQGGALFVVERNIGEVLAALRQFKPDTLLVDDAQLDCALVHDLRRIREETGLDFSIIATCWLGERDTVVHALDIAETQVRRLELLTRPEVVEVVKATGIEGPAALIREIVNQAEGRPGLAVTLAHLCLSGGAAELVSGDALRRSILRPLEPAAGEYVEEILAAFAVGGDTGMSKEAVARVLGLPVLAVRRVVTSLAAGGIIREVDRVREGAVVRRESTPFLSVRPVALRHVLLGDVFFSGTARLDVEPLLAVAPNVAQAALALIGARGHGVAVPQGVLERTVQQAPPAQVLSAYAGLGRDEANWVLERYPEAIVAIARPALHVAPEIAIPRLLEAAVGDECKVGRNLSLPLRLIGDWVAAGRPGTHQAIGRRRAVLESVREWLSAGGETLVGLSALSLALSPGFSTSESDPGMGDTITTTHGCVAPGDVREIRSWWPEVVEILGTTQIRDWKPLLEVIDDWAHPWTVYSEVTPDLSHAMQAFAASMLRDAAMLARNRPGILRRVSRTARQLEVEIDIPPDPMFDALYPPDHAYDDATARDAQASTVAGLAVACSSLDPNEVAPQIAHVEAEARAADLRWPRWTPRLCSEIAARVASPTEWGVAMVAAGCLGDAVEPFLRRAALTGDEGWAELAKDCLNRPALRGCAISAVVTLPVPPAGLLEDVLLHLEGWAQLIETLFVCGEVSEGVARRLLEHQDTRIVAAAALGEWHASPGGSVREGLRSRWRCAVLRSVENDYCLAEVFAADAQLAVDWIRARLAEDPVWSPAYERAVVAATAVLDAEARALILREVPNEHYWADLVLHLVGDSSDLYRKLLDNQRLKHLHLAPLAGYPEGAWLGKAELALDRGYDARRVALAAFRGSPWAVGGSRAALWDDWLSRFEQLSSHPDRRIRAVGKAGADYARKERDSELKEERDEAVYGID